MKNVFLSQYCVNKVNMGVRRGLKIKWSLLYQICLLAAKEFPI